MHTMHSLPGVAVQPNLEMKTRPKQLLGSLPLVIGQQENLILSQVKSVLDWLPKTGAKAEVIAINWT